MSKEDVFKFDTSAAAWEFMRDCDARGLVAGYPSLKAPYTVRVLRKDGAKSPQQIQWDIDAALHRAKGR